MDTGPICAAHGVKRGNGPNRPPRELAEDVEREFGSLVARFGFEPAGWDEDGENGLIRVNFEHPERDDFVQLRARVSDGHVMPVYCRIDGEWETCRSGKPKKFAAFKKTIPRWLEANCDRCSAGCDQGTFVPDGDRHPPAQTACCG